jgi:hypothetical protein
MSTDPYPWLPTPDDVAAILRARTKDSTGAELGRWTADTRPTDTEVSVLIAQSAEFIIGQVGELGDRCAGAAHGATQLHAACLVELSYFPEQVRSDRSPYEQLRELADSALEGLRSCAGVGTAEGGGAAAGEGFGYHSLPVVPATTELTYGYGWRSPEYPATWQQPCFAPTEAAPADVLEPEAPPLPPLDVSIGHPAEGDPDRGLPPIITDG